MKLRGSIGAVSVVGMTLLICASLALGQGIVTGSISGTAQDPEGAVVSGASIHATQVETNRVFATTSSKGGVVQLPSLPPGTYTVVIQAKGCTDYKVRSV